MRKKQIVVIGDSIASEEAYRIAFEVGSFIAKMGYVLISGGRGGIMEAASKGASSNGGLVVGIIPDSDFSKSNEFCDIVIPTGIGFARNSCNVLSGDVITAIGGRTGTLCEIAYAWQYNKPIIAFNNIRGWSSELSGRNLDSRRADIVIGVSNIEDYKRELLELLNN